MAQLSEIEQLFDKKLGSLKTELSEIFESKVDEKVTELRNELLALIKRINDDVEKLRGDSSARSSSERASSRGGENAPKVRAVMYGGGGLGSTATTRTSSVGWGGGGGGSGRGYTAATDDCNPCMVLVCGFPRVFGKTALIAAAKHVVDTVVGESMDAYDVNFDSTRAIDRVARMVFANEDLAKQFVQQAKSNGNVNYDHKGTQLTLYAKRDKSYDDRCFGRVTGKIYEAVSAKRKAKGWNGTDGQMGTLASGRRSAIGAQFFVQMDGEVEVFFNIHEKIGEDKKSEFNVTPMPEPLQRLGFSVDEIAKLCTEARAAGRPKSFG